jgi:hypothetical protein
MKNIHSYVDSFLEQLNILFQEGQFKKHAKSIIANRDNTHVVYKCDKENVTSIYIVIQVLMYKSGIKYFAEHMRDYKTEDAQSPFVETDNALYYRNCNFSFLGQGKMSKYYKEVEISRGDIDTKKLLFQQLDGFLNKEKYYNCHLLSVYDEIIMKIEC